MKKSNVNIVRIKKSKTKSHSSPKNAKQKTENHACMEWIQNEGT